MRQGVAPDVSYAGFQKVLVFHNRHSISINLTIRAPQIGKPKATTLATRPRDAKQRRFPVLEKALERHKQAGQSRSSSQSMIWSRMSAGMGMMECAGKHKNLPQHSTAWPVYSSAMDH